MASVARQPFALLDSARLQNLTSLKNRQNAISPNSSTKRKASLIEGVDDFENVDPGQLAKRSKGLSSFFPNKEVYQSAITLTTKATVSSSSPAPLSTTINRPIASPRLSVGTKSSNKFTGITKSSALASPAGRSPPRAKRSGLLNSRRRSGSYTRIDPPLASSTSAAPFSLDAALKGSIPSYATRSKSISTLSSLAAGKSRVSISDSDSMKDSWFFDIHEDTPEQEMTNLLQHGTCVLDISSDEETENKRRRERDEGRDKENIPPADDISQTSQRRRAGPSANPVPDVMADEMTMMVDQKIEARLALREMDVKEFFADGCDESSIFIVPGDEDAETVIDENEHHARINEGETREYVFAPGQEETEDPQFVLNLPSVEEIMKPVDAEMGPSAALLEPVEGTQAGESFELWESSSAKDEAENMAIADASS